MSGKGEGGGYGIFPLYAHKHAEQISSNLYFVVIKFHTPGVIFVYINKPIISSCNKTLIKYSAQSLVGN